MKKIEVLLDFATFSVTEKVTFYRNIIDKLTDNPSFNNPDVPLTEVNQSLISLKLLLWRHAMAFIWQCQRA